MAVLLFWLTATPLALALGERQLGFHHLLHWVQFTAGLVLSVNWRSRALRSHSAIAAAAVCAGLAYVIAIHLPWALDLAVKYPLLHLTLHGGFVVAGAVVGAAWRDVGELARVLVVVVAMGAMTVVSLAEISGAFAYAAYPPDQEAASGVVMLAGMGLFWVGLFFVDVPGRLSRGSHPRASAAVAVILVAVLAASYWVA